MAASRLTTDLDTKRTPKVILGAISDPLASGLAQHFTKLGWQVKHVADSAAARRAVADCRAYAVFLPTESGTESGFLACAKMAFGQPQTRVVLVGPDRAGYEEYARFAKAAGYVTPDMSAIEAANVVTGLLTPTAN